MPGEKALPLDKRYGSTGVVYDPLILEATEALLSGIAEIRVPEDVRPCIERVYSGLSENQIEAFIQRQTREEMMKISAEAAIFPPPCAEEFFGTYSVAAGKFDHLDEDQGFRIVKGASTRYGDDSVRIAFLDDALFAVARRAVVNRKDEVKILEKTCNIRLTALPKDVMMSVKENQRDEIYKFQSGHLNGCLAVRTVEGVARIGDQVWHVDNEVGVWKEG